MATSLIDTGRITLARLELEDVGDAQDVFVQNQRYHQLVGRPVASDTARQIFDQEPPKPVKGVKVFKRMLGIFPGDAERLRKGDMLGVLDIYVGYPGYHIATVSTFLLRDSMQHKGHGTATLDAVIAWLERDHPAVQWLDVSVTDNNLAATKFLLKNGFDRTDSWHEVGSGDTKRRIIRLERRFKR